MKHKNNEKANIQKQSNCHVCLSNENPGIVINASMFDQKQFGRAVAYFRKKKRWSQSQFAELLGVSDRTICRLENGQTESVNISVLLRLLRLSGASIESVFSRETGEGAVSVDLQLAENYSKCSPEGRVAINRLVDVVMFLEDSLGNDE